MRSNSRARAVAALEIAKRTTVEEHRAKAAALAEMWMTMAVLEDALALWAWQAEGNDSIH